MINISDVSHRGINGFYKFVQSEIIFDETKDKLETGSDCWFVGYPDGKFDITNNLPILRRACIASIPRTDFNGKPQILIDGEVFRGSSGSPVFSKIDGNFRLIGILSEAWTRSGYVEIDEKRGKYEESLGLGLVIKSSQILELIESVREEIINDADFFSNSIYLKSNSK